MIINLLYDQATSNLPSGFTNDVNSVVNYLTSQFTDNLTFNLHVGYGEVEGTALGSNALGESSYFLNSFSYSQIRTELVNDRSTVDDAAAVASLPAADPVTGTHTYWVAQTEAVALGLLSPSTAINMYVGFSNTLPFDYDCSNGITSGAYDFIGTVAHEVTEVMGRELGVSENLVNNAPTDFISDLFHYSSPGVRDASLGGYLSIDGGNTSLGAFNSLASGDPGDWGPSVGNDSFLAFSNPGVYNEISPSDLRWLDILGYNRVVDDYGASVNFAGEVSVGGTQTGTIDYSGDQDWFRVFLTAGTTYTIREIGISAGRGTLADPYLYLYDSSSALLAQDDNSAGGLNAQIGFTPTTSGAYYVDAAASGGGTGTYTISVVAGAPPTITTPMFGLSAFGVQNTWTSQNQFPRAVADVNGDGKADIIGFGNAGVYEALSTGGGNFGTPSLILPGSFGYANSWTSQNQFPRTVADVNGDGQADIIGFGNGGVYESLATGGGNFGTPSLVLPGSFGYANSWTSQDQYPRMLADVNGDGKADIIGFGNGGVYESLATGGGNFAAPQLVLPGSFGYANSWTSQDQYPRFLADVNGDGMADIIGFGNNGVYESLATGGGNFGTSTLVLPGSFGYANSWTSETQYPRMLADVNGDGKADIVGFGDTGVWVALATGGGNFAAPEFVGSAYAVGTSWTSQDLFPRQLGDTIGDGKADVVGFGSAGVYTSQFHV